MLRGYVNFRRQPVVPLVVRGPQGEEITVEALVDTGYNGTLCLPEEMVARLNLPRWHSRPMMLGDGSVVLAQNYRGKVLWEGVERSTRVVATGNEAVLGMALLVGYTIFVDMTDAGKWFYSRARDAPLANRERSRTKPRFAPFYCAPDTPL